MLINIAKFVQISCLVWLTWLEMGQRLKCRRSSQTTTVINRMTFQLYAVKLILLYNCDVNNGLQRLGSQRQLQIAKFKRARKIALDLPQTSHTRCRRNYRRRSAYQSIFCQKLIKTAFSDPRKVFCFLFNIVYENDDFQKLMLCFDFNLHHKVAYDGLSDSFRSITGWNLSHMPLSCLSIVLWLAFRNIIT